MAFNVSHRLCCALVVLLTVSGCSLAPEPLTDDQLEMIARQDRDLIFQNQEAYNEPLTLEISIALALKYNLENRVRLMEEAVADKQLDMSEIELLPSLANTAGYYDRDRPNASRSEAVDTGSESLEPSTSQDQERFNATARMTWNLLDFGVSYLQAKQDADRYLITGKTREKIMLTLIKEVRSAYWKAVAMEQMRGELEDITNDVDEMLVYWQSVREQRLRAPVAVLMDIRALVETRQQLDDIKRSIDTSQARLGNLINAPNFQKINLPIVEDLPALDEVATDIESMELVALRNSADYLSEVYKVRIDQLETRKAMRRLWPGLEFSYASSYDDNSFLVFSNWNEIGVNLTHDITRLIFVDRLKDFRQASEELAVARKLAINMAVVTGVHITWQDYQNSLVKLGRAEYLQEIDAQISDLTSNAEANAKESGAAAIQTRLRAFRSRIGRMQSYADAQTAYGEYMVSLGVNPIPDGFHKMNVEELAASLSKNIEMAMFPYTAEGERLIAERQKFDKWVTTARLAEEARMAEAAQEAEEAREAELAELLVGTEAAVTEADVAASMIQQAAQDTADSPVANIETPAVDLPIPSSLAENDDQSGRSEEFPEPEEMLEDPMVVAVASIAPNANQLLQDFLLMYLPKPSLDDYLDQFLQTTN